jgi:hypothetical protein
MGPPLITFAGIGSGGSISHAEFGGWAVVGGGAETADMGGACAGSLS